ncbi:galactitol-1-phosphate 5-dehydrogenase [Loigolactobacillus zhaoyuanensis]|uniref:Galactitol-1-phosphate 5-dehydrogenase n=1 Tax=Loigolactobacillus zhaoyuanensis TaxID=2486017 RepID=A0ABW8U981_9LACO
MQALAVTGAKQFELQEIARPTATPGNVLIHVAYCGICGSDIPRYFNGAVFQTPQILGHEFAGIVASVGAGVTTIKVGARVAVAPFRPLSDPQTWPEGNPSLSTAEPANDHSFSFIGTKEPGGMAEWVVVPAANCVPLPAGVALHQAAMVEPLAVAIHAVDRISFPAGATVMVLGTGTIGLLTIAVLKARGAGKVIAVDINPNKLAIAQQIGADVLINSQQHALADFFKTEALPQYVFEAAGNPVTEMQALQYTACRGKIVYVGIGVQPLTFPAKTFENLMRRELTMTGSWNAYSAPFPGYEWTTALDYIKTGRIDTAQFITGFYHLADQATPFEEMVTPNSKQVKLMYEISEQD